MTGPATPRRSRRAMLEAAAGPLFAIRARGVAAAAFKRNHATGQSPNNPLGSDTDLISGALA